MKKEITLNIIASILMLLFFYAAVSKLMSYDSSKREMLNQVFPRTIALQLVWAVPTTELFIVIGLLFPASRLKALYAAALLLIIFSLYISITMSGIFGRIPCNCGGIFKNMSYWTHLIFNLIFIVIAIFGIAIEKQWKPINRWFNRFRRKEVTGLN